MSGTDKRTFSLSREQSSFIDAKVKSGQYASGSEVVRAGLRALQERDDAVERWLKEEVSQTYDALMDGEQDTLSIDDFFNAIRNRHEGGNGGS